MKRRWPLAVACAAALLLACPHGGFASAPFEAQQVIPDPDQFEATAPTDDPELEAQVRKLASQLRCPTCQALSIADSPSELAREMEGVIRMRLQEGMTPEEVRASFVDAYGEWILLSPDPSGFNLLIYILPVVVLLLGAGLVVGGMRKWLVQPGEAADGTAAGTEAGDATFRGPGPRATGRTLDDTVGVASGGDREEAPVERVPPAS